MCADPAPLSLWLGALYVHQLRPKAAGKCHLKACPGMFDLNGKMERVCENTVSIDFKQAKMVAGIGESWHSFVPAIRSGDWSDIGGRDYIEDAHVCIPNLAKNFGYNTMDDEVISFYGVFDGHGGKDVAQYVRDNLPRVIVEDAAFPLELEKDLSQLFVPLNYLR